MQRAVRHITLPISRIPQQQPQHQQLALVVLPLCGRDSGTQLLTWRAGSSKAGRGGHKQPSHVKGYERLLQQWAHMTAQPGSSQKGRRGSSRVQPGYAGSFQKETSRKKGRAGKSGGSSSNGWWHGWQDAGMSEAAAARQLHPDELHNLVFSRLDRSSSSSNKGPSRRQQRKQARQRAKLLRKRAAAAGTAHGAYGFGWAEADGHEEGWYDSDFDSDGDSSSDDEYLHGTYSYYSTGSTQQPHRQQGRWQGQDRPDWQWWTEEQERQWFQQSWQRQAGGHSQQQQQRQGQQDRQQQQHHSSSHHRPWWERFEQQQQQHQQQQQRSWRKWGYSSSSSGSSAGGSSTTGAGGSSGWQQAEPSHPPSILPHLSVLGLQSTVQLHRQQLKAAFHKAAMLWHPDKHPDAAAKAAAEAKFKEAKAAYEVLVQHVTT